MMVLRLTPICRPVSHLHRHVYLGPTVRLSAIVSKPKCLATFTSVAPQNILGRRNKDGCTLQRVQLREHTNEPRGPRKENIWTIPNFLTTSRIALTPVLGNYVLHEQFPIAAGLFVLAGFTDMLDGQIARTWPSQKSMFGTILDPLADKFLISTLTITLTIVNLIPLWLTALIVMRDIGLICASFWVRFISMDEPKTLQRFFNVKHATVEFKPTNISKANTVLQLALVWASLGAPILDLVGHPVLVASWYLTGVTTVLSGLSYVIWRENTYTILKPGRKN